MLPFPSLSLFTFRRSTLGALEDIGLIIFALQEELVITPPPGVYITAYLHLNNSFQT